MSGNAPNNSRGKMADVNNTDQNTTLMDTGSLSFVYGDPEDTGVPAGDLTARPKVRKSTGGGSGGGKGTPGSKSGVVNKRKNAVPSMDAPRAKIQAMSGRIEDSRQYHEKEKEFIDANERKKAEARDLLKSVGPMIRNPKQDKDRGQKVIEVVDQALEILAETEEIDSRMRRVCRDREADMEAELTQAELRCIEFDIISEELTTLRSFQSDLEDLHAGLEEEAATLRQETQTLREQIRSLELSLAAKGTGTTMAERLSLLHAPQATGIGSLTGLSEGAARRGFMATASARNRQGFGTSAPKPPPPPTLVVKIDAKADVATESDCVLKVLSDLKVESGDAIVKTASDAIVLHMKTALLREQVKDALIAAGVDGGRLIERNSQNPSVIVKNLRLDKQPEVVFKALLDQNRTIFASNDQEKDVRLLFPRIRRYGQRKNTMDLIIQVSPAIFKRIEMSDQRVKLGDYSVYTVSEYHIVDRCTCCGKIGHSRKRCKACPNCLSEKCPEMSIDKCTADKKVVCFKCGQNHMSSACDQTPRCEPCFRRCGGDSARTEQYSHVLFSQGCTTLAVELDKKRRNTNYA